MQAVVGKFQKMVFEFRGRCQGSRSDMKRWRRAPRMGRIRILSRLCVGRLPYSFAKSPAEIGLDRVWPSLRVCGVSQLSMLLEQMALWDPSTPSIEDSAPAIMLHKLLLTFNDPGLEKSFRDEFNTWGAKGDKLTLIFTCALRATILFRLWTADVKSRDFIATLIVSIPVLVEYFGRKYMERNCPALLEAWRPTLVSASRFYMSMFFGRCIPFWLSVAARHTSADELVKMYPPWLWHFAASGIPLRFALTFGMPTLFAHHLPLMAGTTIFTSLTAHSYYCKFVTAPVIAPYTHIILRTSDFISEFAWDGEQTADNIVPNELGCFPCARLLLFSNIFWGIFVASFVWWNLELHMRTKFLRKTLGDTPQVKSVVRSMAMYPRVVASFSVPIFSILWRGTGSISSVLQNLIMLYQG